MFEPILAAVIVALLSLTGVLFFGKSGHLTGTHRFIIPIAIGVFLGIVFFELIPETITAAGVLGSIAITSGFLGFYLLSHLLRAYHHHHCSDEPCEQQSNATLLLIGDAVHNIADGVVLVAAFAVNPAIGVATTIGIALHEIPQEIAEFGVLVKAGYSRLRAALYNLISASSILIGVVVSLLLIEAGDYIWILTGIAAGNLLYIAASDLIPEINRESHRAHFGQTFLSTVIGLVAITLLITWAHEFAPHEGHDDHDHAIEEAEHSTLDDAHDEATTTLSPAHTHTHEHDIDDDHTH